MAKATRPNLRGAIGLDDRDVKMLAILQTEGRISVTALAERIALSPSACHDRMRRLERGGVIEGYGARLAKTLLGPHVQVLMTVELQYHRAHDFARFEATIAEADLVTACWAVGGGTDYVVQVTAPDIHAYQRFADRLLNDDVGIARYFSYVITKTIKDPGAPSLPTLPAGADR